MTRKDYVMIAEAVKDAKDEAIVPAMIDSLKTVALYIADGCKRENARFDRSRFMSACGFSA